MSGGIDADPVMPTHRGTDWPVALARVRVLLGLGTLTHQPPIEDFDAYARYITTDVFLVSHLGQAFSVRRCLLGVVAVTAYLVPGRAARLAVVGLILTTIANIYLSAAFGSAAFVQPGIGRAHLAGVRLPALNADTAYGPALGATAFSATVCSSSRQSCSYRDRTTIAVSWGRGGDAVLLPLFAISGFLLPVVQFAAGFAEQLRPRSWPYHFLDP